jgi:peptide-methionine (R)-S-oxide reductase
VLSIGLLIAYFGAARTRFFSNQSTTTSSQRTSTYQSESPEQLSRLTNGDWKKLLTPSQYRILRENGTEIPFTSSLVHETRAGTFVTADCGEPVFRSDTKFDSGTGWPSFYQPIASSSIVIKTDTSLGMTREEVETPICHSHIGHLFHDAPQTPTGNRFCINGAALRFVPDGSK